MTATERAAAVYHVGLTTVTQAEVARDLATQFPDQRKRIEAGLALLHTREFQRMPNSGIWWVQGAPSKDARRAVDWYRVDPAAGTCICPDYQARGGRCKHQWAIEIRRLAASRALREERLNALMALAGCPDQATIDQLRRPA